LTTLHRPDERLRELAELEALAGALGDPTIELETMLRRAAAFRLLDDGERGAELARQVRNRAAAAGDRRTELAASLELGQALMGSPMGAAFVPLESEMDVIGAGEAFERAVALATELHDDANLAAATRELGVIDMAQVRVQVQRLSETGQIPEDLGNYEPVVGPMTAARMRFQAALELYERLDDRRGMMLSIISIAYSTWGAEGYLGSVKHLEAIRRLNTLQESLTSESERAQSEAEMLFSIHTYGRVFGYPDVALARGAQAFRAAREVGDRALEAVVQEAAGALGRRQVPARPLEQVGARVLYPGGLGAGQRVAADEALGVRPTHLRDQGALGGADVGDHGLLAARRERLR